ncbi:MAG TPA: hypothetical protein VMU64_04120 [Acidimicrobiales bacterium]|nr:hypothetical protein [Acidimicrobiales bacterium]
MRRQPQHAAKRARRHRRHVQATSRLPRSHLHVLRPHLHIPRPHLHVPRPQLHVPRPRVAVSSSTAALVALVARWRGGRATLSLERRRARTMLIGAIVFACIVLLTSFPIGGLLSQRSALSSTAHELTTVEAENEILGRQVEDLSNPATVSNLARQDYGFVAKGQRVYDILPSSSPSRSALAASGQVPLNGPPVVPGSARSQALIGVVAPATAASSSHASGSAPAGGGGSDGGSSVAGSGPAPPEPHSYWGRVVRTLEFWN